MKDVATCARLLAEKKLSICFAESASAGYLAYAFSLTEESGDILRGSLICYDATLKIKLLDVPKELINRFSAESPEVTRAMVQGIEQLIPADIAVAVTGLPKPGGSETPEKPVGTVFYAIGYQGAIHDGKTYFGGSPAQVVKHAVAEVVRAITRLV